MPCHALHPPSPCSSNSTALDGQPFSHGLRQPLSRRTKSTNRTQSRRLNRNANLTIRPAAVVAPPPSTAGPLKLDDVDLEAMDSTKERVFDLVIAGAGPSGLAVADRVSRAGFRVCIVDPEPRSWWPNNYGVWVDEFEAMGMGDCLEFVWPKAKVFLDDASLGAKYLKRPYGRVDRPKLKRKFLERCLEQGVRFHCTKVEDINHHSNLSEIKCTDGSALEATLVLDATGYARKLVTFDREFDPGYQAAYGLLAEVESHPFEVDTMVFMDWRDYHTQGRPEMRARNQRDPTFMYAMPFSENRIFLEETSLVARPPLPFQELKARFDARVESLGIKITHIEEEEYCLIPMGGVLPKRPQRVVGIGGTAGMVHPSTGYMVSRMLGAVPTLADALIEQLSAPHDKATELVAMHSAPNSDRPIQLDAGAAAAELWRVLWPAERIRQREFFCFGMEVTLQLDLQQTREFFSAFFSLSEFHWQGFLSSRLSFSELLVFGLSLFMYSTNEARVNLLQKGIPGLLVMLVNLSKTLGD